MAVVVMVSIAAAVAIPQVTKRMRDRRVQEAALRIANIYRGARMRAMGRGSAMLVRFTSGEYIVREAQRGALEANAACAPLPVSSCTTTDWNNAAAGQYRELPGFDVAAHGEYGTGASATSVAMQSESGGTLSSLDVCFTPLGRAFTRSDFSQELTALTSAKTAEISRSGFRTRRIVVLPNGSARLTP